MLLRLTGDLDVHAITPLVDQLDAAARDGDHQVILDFELVEFAGAAALRLIVVAHHHHMHVTVRHPSAAILRLLAHFPELTEDVTVET